MNAQEASLAETMLVNVARLLAQVPLEEYRQEYLYGPNGWRRFTPNWEATKQQREAERELIEAALPLWRLATAGVGELKGDANGAI